MSAHCRHNVRTMLAQCRHNVRTMSAQHLTKDICRHNVRTMSDQCRHNVRTISFFGFQLWIKSVPKQYHFPLEYEVKRLRFEFIVFVYLFVLRLYIRQLMKSINLSTCRGEKRKNNVQQSVFLFLEAVSKRQGPRVLRTSL